MKVSGITTKTIRAATADALDAAVLAFVQTLAEDTLVDWFFAVVAGEYVVHIVYTL